jgi:hypothetical protein
MLSVCPCVCVNLSVISETTDVVVLALIKASSSMGRKYRPTSLLNSFSKVYELVISDELRNFFSISLILHNMVSLILLSLRLI